MERALQSPLDRLTKAAAPSLKKIMAIPSMLGQAIVFVIFGPVGKLPNTRRFALLGGIVYGLLFYGWLMAALTFNRSVLPSMFVGWFEFLPLVALELAFMKIFRRRGIWQGLLFFGRLLIIWMIFYFWALSFMDPWRGFGWMPSHVTHGGTALTLFIYARPYVALAQSVIFLLAYLFIWTKHRKGAFLFGVLAFPTFLMINYVVFYTTDWTGVTREEVEAQDGVRVLADSLGPCDLSQFDIPLYLQPLIMWAPPHKFPRALYFDEPRHRIYVSYGTIWPVRSPCPNFYSVNTSGEEKLSNLVGVAAIREFQPAPESDDLFLSAWGYDYKIYRVGKDDLKINEEISFEEYRAQLKEYDVYDTIDDLPGQRIFLITGQPPSIIRYDMATTTTTVLDLSEQGITEFGSILHTFRYDAKRNLIVITAVTGDNGGMVITVDPDKMLPVKAIKMPSIVISVEFDPLSDEIMVGDGLNPRLYFLNAETLELLYSFETPAPCIRRMIPLPDRNSILTVDHLRGRLFEIDRYDGRVLQSFKVGNKPIGLDRDGGRVYVASTLGVVKVRLGEPLSDSPSPYLFPEAEEEE